MPPYHIRLLSAAFLDLTYTSREAQRNRQVSYPFLEVLVERRQSLTLLVLRSGRDSGELETATVWCQAYVLRALPETDLPVFLLDSHLSAGIMVRR